jgi:hypothetical protein
LYLSTQNQRTMPGKFLFSFFFLISLLVGAQEKNIVGRIIIDLDDSSPEGIYITNSRTNITAITDLTGSFSMRVQAGDDLLIRSTFYESRKFLITEPLLTKELITIHLSLQTILLDEAVITKKLTGYLEVDAKYSGKKDVITKLYEDLGVNPDASKLRDSTKFTFGKDISLLHLNVEKALEAMTGDLRRRQNLYAFEGKELVIQEIQDFFGEEYFINDLEIPKEKIREFVYYSYETSIQIQTSHQSKNYLTIMTELQKMAPIYLTRLKNWNAPLQK